MEIKIGDRFGYLTVARLNNETKRGKSWVCKCACGKEIVVSTARLTKATKSCGCKQFRQNGFTVKNLRLHAIYKAMISRCYNERQKDYYMYGAIGVSVCDEWKNSYESFYEWAMSNGYADDLEIDRIDSCGNYEPSNCRWVDEYVQSQNQRMQKNNTSGCKGVTERPYGYTAEITRYGEKHYLGFFKSFEDAVEARKQAEIDFA